MMRITAFSTLPPLGAPSSSSEQVLGVPPCDSLGRRFALPQAIISVGALPLSIQEYLGV